MSQEIGAKPPAPLELGWARSPGGNFRGRSGRCDSRFQRSRVEPGRWCGAGVYYGLHSRGRTRCRYHQPHRFQPQPDLSHRLGRDRYTVGGLLRFMRTSTSWDPRRMASSRSIRFMVSGAGSRRVWITASGSTRPPYPAHSILRGPNAVPENRFTQASLKIPLRPGTRKREFFLTHRCRGCPRGYGRSLRGSPIFRR